jgi:hypothetical protein
VYLVGVYTAASALPLVGIKSPFGSSCLVID